MSGQGVWLVEGYCGSFYCNEHHPVGVFSTREQAEAVATDTPELQGKYGPEYTTLSVVELPLDRAVLRDDLRMGCH